MGMATFTNDQNQLTEEFSSLKTFLIKVKKASIP